MRRFRSAALALLTLVSAPALADAVEPAITVTGQTYDAARREAGEFVWTALPIPFGDQHARWHEAICPAVENIRPASAERIRARIIEMATAVGVAVAKPGCRPNILVFFSADGAGTVADTARRRPHVFDNTIGSERARLRDPALPMRWWYQLDKDSVDGRQLFGAAGPLLATPNLVNLGLPFLSGQPASRHASNTRAKITGATVIIDARLAEGHSLDALADQAALVSLARTRLGGDYQGFDTVLALFDRDAGNRPAGLTPFDEAYLRSLYLVPADRPAQVQRGGMAATMASLLTSQP